MADKDFIVKNGLVVGGDLTTTLVKFNDNDASNWVAFASPATVSSNITWTLPSADAGVSGYALVSNGSGTLSWAAAGATTSSDESTNTNFLIHFDNITSGAVTAVKHDTGLTYNPSTGTLAAATFSGAFSGALTGNAATATKLATTRAIQVSGAVTGTANFDGSAAINIVTTNTADPTITLAGDLSGAVTLTNLASGTLTATVGTLNQNTTGSAATLTTARAIQVSGAVTGTANFDGSAAINIVTTATNDPTITLAGDLSGAVTLTNLASGTLTATVGTLNQDTTGSAATLTTARAIQVSGAVTGTANFDGSAAINIVTTHTADPVITLNGAVTGSGTMTNLGSVTITTTNTADPVLTLTGDVSGSATFTNLGNASLAVVVADDSHNHSSSSGNFQVNGVLTTTANTEIQGNLQVDGNLTVSGTSVTVNVTNLDVDDNILFLNATSAIANPDLGWVGNYNDGVAAKSGFFRDASDGYFKTFKGYTSTTGATIDTSHASFALADIQAANFRGELVGNASTATIFATARTINGVSFNGSANITVEPYIEDDEGTAATRNIVFTDNTTAGFKRLNEDSTLTYNPSTNTLSAVTFSGALSGNATTATTLQTARAIALTGAVTGTANFDGSADISITTTATNDPTLTLAGDATGSATFTNLGNATLTVAIVDDSHEHKRLSYQSDPSVAPDYALEYINISGSMTDSPTTDWWNIIRMGHGDPNTYYNNTLAMKMTGSGVGGLWGRTRVGGTAGSWFRFFDDNYHPNADTLTTARTINGVSFNGSANITVADDTKLPLAGGTATGTISAPTFNATSTTNGGFQGIDADTALLPSFTWTSDQNTGMWHAGTDQIGFTTAGVNRMIVMASGNVGIGTSSPAKLLTVHYDAPANNTVDDLVRIVSKYNAATGASALAGSGPSIVFAGGIGDNQTRDRARIVAPYESSNRSGLAFHTQDTADIITEKMRIQNNGNVGIGTTSPVEKLDVVGTVRAETFNATSTTNGGFQGIDADSITLPSFTWTSDLDTGMWHAAADSIGFTTGGVNRITINSAGISGAGAGLTGLNGSNISSGTVAAARVATLNQSTTGNAATATALQTARTINGVSFNGTGNITVADATKLPLAGGTMTGDILYGTADRDHSQIGTYDSTKTQQIWSMGAAYKNSATGVDFGTLYGMSYKHSTNTTGGTMAGGHQIVFANNGTAGAAIGMAGNIWTSGVSTAATFNATSVTSGGFQGIDADTITAPSFTWTSDLDTGMWHAAADQIGFTTGGVNRITINSAGISGAGAGLTSLNASNISSGTIAAARVPTLNQSTTGSAATLTTARTINGVSFNGSANITVADGTKLPLTGGTLSDNLLFSNSGTTKRGILGTNADNDFWFVGGGGTASNAGFLEIATGDDGQGAGTATAEPIYVSQYGPGNPLTGTLVRQGALLDASGNTNFPGTITGATFNATSTTNGGFQGIDADTIAAPSFTWTSDLDTGMWHAAADAIGFTTGGVNRITINSAGISGAGAGLTGLNASNISSGTIAAARVPTLNQNTTGSAATLTTARTINGVSFNGSANITVADATKLPLAGGTMTGALALSQQKIDFHSGAGGTTFGANHYSMGVDIANGAWTGPNYSDLIIGYHTGIRIGAAYSGVRFYNNSPTTDTNNTGNGNGVETLLMTIGGGGTTNSGANVTVTNQLNAATFNATSVTSGGFQGIDADSITAPSFTWTSDLNTGMWHAGTDQIGFTTAGTNQMTITTTGVTAVGTVTADTFNATSTTNGGFQGIDADTITAPSFTWTSDLNTGMWHAGTDSIGFTTAGVNRLTISTADVTSTLRVRTPQAYIGTGTTAPTSPGMIAITSTGDPYISWHATSAVTRGGYMQYIAATDRFLFGDVAYTESAGSFRAPAFYDTAGTTYYLKPSSALTAQSTTAGSYLNDLRINTLWNGGVPANAGPIRTYTLTSGGTLYTNGTYLNTVVSGGQGVYATFDFTVVGGIVTVATLTERGSGFQVSNTLAIPALGATGSGGLITVNTVDTVDISLYGATPRIRFGLNDVTTAAGQEIGTIFFNTRDASAGGSGDKAFIRGVAGGTSGGGEIEFWTSANGGAPTLCAKIGGSNDFRLYNTAGTFYHAFSNAPTANQTLTLPNITGTALVTSTTVNTAGYFNTGTTTPTGTTRLNYSGYLYPTFLNLIGSSDTATAATHYYVETGSDGYVRPKTLANVKTEIVTGAAVAAGITATALTTTQTITAGTFNATSTTGGGFQGIDADLITTPSFTWTSDLNTGMWHAAADAIGFTTGGVNRLTIASTLITSTVQVNATTFNATSTSGGGFQGIDADTAAIPSFTWTSDTNTGMWHAGTDQVGFTTAGVNRLTLSTTALTCTLNIVSNSDIRLKKDIEKITAALEKVKKLNGVNFTKIDNDSRSTGLIAQDVQAVLPEAVSEGDDGYLSVAYGNMVGLLVEAIKEQDSTINSLRNDVETLKDLVNKLMGTK